MIILNILSFVITSILVLKFTVNHKNFNINVSKKENENIKN